MFLRKNIEFFLNKQSTYQLKEVLCIQLQTYLDTGLSLINPQILLELAASTSYLIDSLFLDDIELKSEISSNIKMIVFDVDGVMTDAGMYYTESGDEMKKFNAKDGLAIRDLAKSGMLTGIISHGINVNLIKRRADLLGIQHVYAGNRPKTDVLAEWCQQLGINFENVAFIGDDINDLPIIRIVGFSACPSDAVNLVKAEVNMVLRNRGGEGVIREWIDTCFTY
jgi:3-deoxy-D-manno-octulosonate 8-phosphate phosphatase (KDO 8-P phosphatase)